ncbi:MAG: IS3 family transposase [Faecalibacterium sp.]
MSPSAYYKWKSGNPSQRIQENKHIASLIEKIHMDSPDKGYRRIHDDLERFHNVHSNDKRILRIRTAPRSKRRYTFHVRHAF